MDGFFIFVGGLAVVIGFWWVVINFFRKKSKKRPALIFAAGFVFVVIGGALAPTPSESAKETDAVEEKAEAPEVAEQTQAEKDAEAAEQKKAEEDKAAAEKVDAEKKLAAEKEFYVNEVQTKVDTQMGMYDEAWDSLWVTTFNGVSDGSTDVYTAYDNMKQLQQRYETLQSSIPAIPSEGLSKENKENLSAFQEQMVTASRWRASAAEKAQAMFDAGTFSPSEMDEVKADVEIADSEMLSAIVSLTSLEMELGIERE